MAKTITWKKKKGRPKKGQTMRNPKEPKKEES